MQLVKAGSSVLLPPNLCFICESTPIPGTDLVDTVRDYNSGERSIPLSGRKYVCESCVNELAAVLGLGSTDATEIEKAKVVKLEAAIADVRKKLAVLMDEVVDHVHGIALVENAPVQAPSPWSVPRVQEVKAELVELPEVERSTSGLTVVVEEQGVLEEDGPPPGMDFYDWQAMRIAAASKAPTNASAPRGEMDGGYFVSPPEPRLP